ncbi:MAG: 16S rRNA (cytosine(967)-C(5))-methyltransferase RsmB [Deltaproteobacteria bacterium]
MSRTLKPPAREREFRKSSARYVAFKTLNRVLIDGAYPDLALDAAFRSCPALSPEDKALATELIMGALRWLRRIDFAIVQFTASVNKKEVMNILRIGAYQLLFLDKIPDYAAVSEAVNIAKGMYGEQVGKFVNAVLRQISRGNIQYPTRGGDPLEYLSICHSIPRWLAQRWVDWLGFDRAEALVAALNNPPRLTLRANRLKIGREELIERLGASGIASLPTQYSPDGVVALTRLHPAALKEFEDGLFTVQDEAAQLLSYFLDPSPGQSVLDACSAPGGKATHIAELMQGRGEIVAEDIHAPRLRLVDELSRRLGIGIIKTRIAGDDPAACGRLFDRVLVDAPCSGFGTLRRNPDGKWTKTEADVLELSGLQFRILSRAARSVKMGGVLLFAVCTLIPEENEQVCRQFLGAYPEFALDTGCAAPLRKFIGESGFFSSDPAAQNMDGFFAAKFRRVA